MPTTLERGYIPEQLKRKRFVDVQKPQETTEASSLHEYIVRFDATWQKEGLPQDWYNLRGEKQEIGFSMQKQMNMLQDPSDKDALASWTAKTKQDLVGFKLEYLSRHVVYPCKYERSADGKQLINPEYQADMDETVSAEERNGSVKKALQEMKAFFLDDNTPDGAIGVMASPKGPSGMKTDRGQSIDYPDSYFFVMQKNGDTVTNYTIKTDFSLHESREVIYQLTGKKLPVTASVEEYVRTIATIKPDDASSVNSVTDVARVLQTVRPSHAFKSEADGKTKWNDVYKDIAQGEKLYEFNANTREIIAEFEQYAKEGTHTKEDLQKAIAATILRMSQLFLQEKEQHEGVPMSVGRWRKPDEDKRQLFGRVLNAVSERPGCAGGGSKGNTFMVSSFGGGRMGIIGGKEQEWFTCPECFYQADGPVGNSCPSCGLTKEQYAEKSGVSCD